MKTAISIPDKVFYAAENTAKQLGIPRSRLYTKAIEEYVEHHNKDGITEKLNDIYGNTVSEDELFLENSVINLRKAVKHDTW